MNGTPSLPELLSLARVTLSDPRGGAVGGREIKLKGLARAVADGRGGGS